ncbi:MAG: hypothetical protein ABJE47_18075 [bacterium]
MTMQIQRPSSRRGFITTLAAGSAALAASGVAMHVAAATAAAQPIAPDDYSDKWIGKLTGKHKQYFDLTSVNSGFGMVYALNFLNANNEASRIPDNKLSAVVGMRHFSVPMAFTDDLWAKYKFGEFFQITDPATKAPATRNFFYHPKEGDLPFPGSAIDKLLARGVQFPVCNVALTLLSQMTSHNAGTTPEEAKAEWKAHLIPGMSLAPSGVWAVNRAQEAGCTYCAAG